MKRGHNIDEDFAKAMAPIGGRRPRDIDPACLTDDNADIVLVHDSAIVEVKTLMEDTRDKKDFNKTYATMHEKWVKQGKVPVQKGTRIRLNTRDLPEACAHELIRHLTKRPAAHVQKANRQIERLKEALGMPDAKGIMVLCNSGNAFLPPDVMLYGLRHILQGDIYSSVHWLIYMTHNLPVKLHGMLAPADLFIPLVRDGGTPMPQELYDRIHSAWMRYVSAGTVLLEYGARPADLFDVRHVGMAAPSPKR